MKKSKIELPSNRKFGFFFSAIFITLGLYFYTKNLDNYFFIFCVVGTIFLLITFFNEKLLSPFNKLWMQLGLLLGRIVSPIILGIIFYLLFTPIAIISKLFGRDELRIRFKTRRSHWKLRNKDTIKDVVFDKQF